jgi:hypothetical protein
VEPGVPAAEEAQEERALVLVWFWIGGGERHVHEVRERAERGDGPAVIRKKS